MRRSLWMLLAALLVAVVVGDAVVWNVTVQRMRAGLDDWLAAARAAGWSVGATPPEAGGWPVAATLTLRDFTLQGGAIDIPGGLGWRAERVVLRLDPRRPHDLEIDAEGAQRLRLAASPDIPYTADRLQLLVPLQADPSVQALNLRGEALRASVPAAGATDILTLDRLDVDATARPAAGKGQTAAAVLAKLDGVGLPARLHAPLGQRIDSVALDAALDGPLPAATGPTARATAWRDDGGLLDVRDLETHWGPLALTAKARLTLDPDLQPTGTGIARATGYAETMDALARNGAISRSAATAIKAVLSLLASTPESGGPSEVEVPLSLQHRTLSMHDMPLVRLPALDWPPS